MLRVRLFTFMRRQLLFIGFGLRAKVMQNHGPSLGLLPAQRVQALLVVLSNVSHLLQNCRLLVELSYSIGAGVQGAARGKHSRAASRSVATFCSTVQLSHTNSMPVGASS
ncbi:unnamed protein product [Symbiodinium natans]|uniref:Uncharacterized protein n=1 Tax=Symbiodinium natans TaxID=878477 RepID=A0A812PQI3_9DINO|nr:unnamed protein product [Symbiodinium natans]